MKTFNDLYRMLMESYLINEEIDFDSKPGFEQGSDKRKFVDEVINELSNKNSIYYFNGLNPRFTDGYLLKRADRMIQNKWNPKDIAENLMKFQYCTKFHSKEMNELKKSTSIDSYSYPDLLKFVKEYYYGWYNSDKKKKEQKVELEKSTNEGAELVLETDKYKVYKITTEEASIKYGRNTTWCISADGEDNMWDDYEDYIHYFIIDKRYYDSEKYAPKGTNDEYILNKYPTSMKPKYAKIVVSLDKSFGGFEKTSSSSFDQTNENQDCNDERIKNKELFELLKELDMKVYNFFIKFKSNTVEDKVLNGTNEEKNKIFHFYPQAIIYIPENKKFDVIKMFEDSFREGLKNNPLAIQFMPRDKIIEIVELYKDVFSLIFFFHPGLICYIKNEYMVQIVKMFKNSFNNGMIDDISCIKYIPENNIIDIISLCKNGFIAGISKNPSDFEYIPKNKRFDVIKLFSDEFNEIFSKRPMLLSTVEFEKRFDVVVMCKEGFKKGFSVWPSTIKLVADSKVLDVIIMFRDVFYEIFSKRPRLLHIWYNLDNHELENKIKQLFPDIDWKQ